MRGDGESSAVTSRGLAPSLGGGLGAIAALRGRSAHARKEVVGQWRKSRRRTSWGERRGESYELSVPKALNRNDVCAPRALGRSDHFMRGRRRLGPNDNDVAAAPSSAVAASTASSSAAA